MPLLLFLLGPRPWRRWWRRKGGAPLAMVAAYSLSLLDPTCMVGSVKDARSIEDGMTCERCWPPWELHCATMEVHRVSVTSHHGSHGSSTTGNGA